MPGGGLKRSPCAVAKRTTDEGDQPGGTTSKEGDEKRPASSAKGGSKDGAAGQAESAAEAGEGAAKAGAAPARGKESVYQPTPSTGMKPIGSAPAPDPVDDRRAQSGYGRNTSTGQAKHVYSTLADRRQGTPPHRGAHRHARQVQGDAEAGSSRGHHPPV